ncbi:MAG: dihydrofolate reductase [Marinifilaceae bacterium]
MEKEFEYFVEQFSDLKILRYKLNDFDKFSLDEKLFVYYLSQAAISGRDILWDQNYKHNLKIREILESIYKSFSGDRSTEDFKTFEVYFKRILFANGIHHHYSMDKIMPAFSRMYFDSLLSITKMTCDEEIKEAIFDKDLDNKRVILDSDKDIIADSANNFYKDLTQEEVEDYYSKKDKGDEKRPLSIGLNSQLVKEDGQIVEKVWKIGGMYSKAIEQIVCFLEKAKRYAPNPQQKTVIELLVEYYKTGDLKTFDDYSIEWISEVNSPIDFINGFIEVYGDSLAYKGSWESIVNYTDVEATKRATLMSDNAQWFEDNSPVDKAFKKDKVAGVSAKVVNMAVLAGDCYPYTPIGINLPNAEWIRAEHGSKSVTVENIMQAYHMSSLDSGMLDEFAYSKEEMSRARKWGFLGGCLHTDLHECLGHGSGKLLNGVGQDALKNYHSTIEEARADLFALYYIMDDKLIELGIVPDMDVAKSEYDSYIRGGLVVQLTRIEKGAVLEESHMRNRQIIAKWAYEKGLANNVIEKKIKDGKIFFVVNDYNALRDIFADLLREVQRIKSEGDYEAGKALVEDYGVKFDTQMHEDILIRFKKLNLSPYSGFLNPKYELIKEGDKIVGVDVKYSETFLEQMLRYGTDYSFL